MKTITRAISNAKRQLLFAKFVDCFLTSLVTSIAVMGVLLLFKLPFVYAAIVGGVTLAVGFYRAKQRASLEEIEKKVPGLEWQLRTAADTTSQHNEIVDTLHEDVQTKIGYMNIMDLFSGKRALGRVFLFVVFLIGIVYMQNTQFNLIDSYQEIKEQNEGVISNKLNGLLSFDDDGEISEDALEDGDRDIYGEETEELLGDNEITLELNAEENIVNLDELKNTESKSFKEKGFTGSINDEQDASYDENINSEDEVIIKQFYDNLNN